MSVPQEVLISKNSNVQDISQSEKSWGEEISKMPLYQKEGQVET